MNTTTTPTPITTKSDATGERDESVEQDDDPGNPTRSAQPASLLRSFVRSTAAPRSVFLLLMLLLVCGWCDADDAAAAGASPHDVVDWAGMSECRTGKAVARACCCTTGVEQRRKRAWAGALQRQRTSPPLGLPRFPPSPLSYPPPPPFLPPTPSYPSPHPSITHSSSFPISLLLMLIHPFRSISKTPPLI